ncbi:MAG: dTDP-4-dehydrorhamnose 3,5-epimerase, partial [Deltaproteobacteria bacterium]
NKYMIYIPKGFAHGVCILENDTELLYKVAGGEYSPEHDRSIRWNDPEINIIWPIREPTLSERDASAPFLKDADNNFIYEKNTKEGY